MIEHKIVERTASQVDQVVYITTTAGDADTRVLAPYEQVIEVNSALGTLGIYMPPVASAKGRFYSIIALTGATKTVTVYDSTLAPSHDWPGDISLNANLDRVLLFSDGKRWWVISDMFT